VTLGMAKPEIATSRRTLLAMTMDRTTPYLWYVTRYLCSGQAGHFITLYRVLCDHQHDKRGEEFL
jgi:hypothetical protein